VYLGSTCNLPDPKYFPLVCPIYKPDKYEIRKILQILFSFSMLVNLGLCVKSVKWKKCKNIMSKRISESKKLEGTGFLRKLHTKDYSMIYLIF
jgi:hypothetical protein